MKMTNLSHTTANIYREKGRRTNSNNNNKALWRTYGSTSTPKMQKDMENYWQKRRSQWKSDTKEIDLEQKQRNIEQKLRNSQPTRHSVDTESQWMSRTKKKFQEQKQENGEQKHQCRRSRDFFDFVCTGLHLSFISFINFPLFFCP